MFVIYREDGHKKGGNLAVPALLKHIFMRKIKQIVFPQFCSLL